MPNKTTVSDNEREHFSFHGEAINDRQVAISLPNDQNGVIMQWGNAEYWNIRANTWRGVYRHACTEQVLRRLKAAHQGYKMSTATARVLSIGGVKGTGASKLMTPTQIDLAKAQNPQIEVFGCNEPAFFSGGLNVANMRAEDPIDRDNKRSYNLQVVRRPLSHGLFTADDLSDPEKIAEFSEINRYRSQLEGLSKLIGGLDFRMTRKTDPKVQKQLDTAYAELQKLTKHAFTSAVEVREFLEAELASIRARGFSTVSEQTIPVGQEVIPSGTRMNHSIHLIGISRIGCGLLMDGISTKMFRHPFIGGRAASGCGGYVSVTYKVRRLIANQWIDDCTIELVPERHVIFHDARHSVLRTCLEAWQQCDIDRFDFTFEGLRRLTGNGSNGEELAC